MPPDHAKILAAHRRQLEAVVQQLIDLLDAFDGDADLEPETDHAVDDEPCDDLYGEALARVGGLP